MIAPVRLTSLTLRNFKAVGDEPQTISFAPITLLFGPNSAGKSTIIHALHYAREILCNRNLDPHQIQGDALDLGGFRSLVHNHESDRTIELSIGAHVCGVLAPPPWWEAVDPREWTDNEKFSRVLGRFDDLRMTMSIRWSYERSQPFVAEYSTSLGGRPFARISARADGRGVTITKLDLAHPICDLMLFRPEKLTLEKRQQLLRVNNALVDLAEDEFLPVSVSTTRTLDALPEFDSPLALQLQSNYDLEPLEQWAAKRQSRKPETYFLRSINQIVSVGLVWPGSLLQRSLNELLHIGPFRDVPPRRFSGRKITAPVRWFKGLAAWDEIAHADREFIRLANKWLNLPYRLNTGFSIKVRSFYELPVDHPISVVLQRGNALLDVEVNMIPRQLADLPIDKQIFLTRDGTETDLEPADLGVGLSQLVPVVVAALRAEAVLIAVEQPELHNHPAVQVALGDLFIAAALHPHIEPAFWSEEEYEQVPNEEEKRSSGKRLGDQLDVAVIDQKEGHLPMFLIETHSEHLILRLLRRIRETAAGELPPGAPALKPDDIAVYYVEPGPDGVRVRHLRVNNEGDFIDRWPRGFFEERVDELF